MRYSKPPLNIPDQLQQLRDRGLLVGSDDLALNALELTGYYRLSAYWLFFEEPPASGETRSHRFKPGSSFEQVIELYNKDRLIRLMVIDAIERIEIAARSAWVQEMSMKHGPHCYLAPQLFQRRRRQESGKRQCSGLSHCSRGQAHGHRANERGKLSEDYRFIQVPQAMGSWPLAQLLFYQYKRIKKRAERLRGNGSTQSKAMR